MILHLRAFFPFLFSTMLAASPAGVAAAAPDTTEETSAAAPLYLDPTRPAEERARDLVARMTLEEKVSQMVDEAPAIPRLGVPAYNWWNECLHGVARAGYATVFPQAIGLAATWNPRLLHQMAAATADEARAKYHDAIRRDNHDRYFGLTMWSPNINIFRDPRWGRGQETYGEDPYLTSRLGVAFVRGLQGDDDRYLKVVSTPKHFAVHSGPEQSRHYFDADTAERDLHETYLPAFKATIQQANAQSVMCAYNRFRGEACCASGLLLMEVLRNEWGFDGYVVSDCWAIEDIYKHHQIVRTQPTAAAMAVKLGCDLNCGSAYRSLKEAVDANLITESELDIALVRLFRARFKLGMFDPDNLVPCAQTPIEIIDSPQHQQLALECARQSLVLLKNENHTLPLSPEIKRLAVIGPLAKSEAVLVGNYHGTPRNPITLLEGILSAAPDGVEIHHTQGCQLVGGRVVDAEVIPKRFLRANDQNGLRAEFYDNENLEGAPTGTFIGESVNFADVAAFTAAHPDLPTEHFSVRWTGEIVTDTTGEYHIGFEGDDGYRVDLDGERVLDEWRAQPALERHVKVKLSAGVPLPIRIEYFQGASQACARLLWQPKPANDKELLDEAVSLAQASDAVVLTLGLTAELEGEEMRISYDGFAGGDRTRLDLPETQRNLIKAVQATGKPVVLVLCTGSAVAVNWANEHLPAILLAWYPGQAGGAAVGQTLFGDYNPAGRLPVTFYRSVDDLPPFEDYAMANRTYRYFKGAPLYPFGHGLSYADFEYSSLSIAPAQASPDDTLTISLAVKNVSNIDGEEVVQVYARDVKSEKPMPNKTLVGFERIAIPVGETKQVRFTIPASALHHYDVDQRRFRVEPGDFEIQVGASSADIRLKQTITVN